MNSSRPARKAATKHSAKASAWEYPEKSGIRITTLKNKTSGKDFGLSYRVRIPAKLIGKPRARETYQFRTREEAERKAEDRFLALRQFGTAFAEMPLPVQQQALAAWHLLKTHEGLDFVATMEAGIKALRPTGGVKKLSEVTTELRASKTARFNDGRLDKTTHKDFEGRSLKIDSAMGSRPINTITTEEIRQWLASIRAKGADGKGALSRRSVLNYRNTLSEIFAHAESRQYVAQNPFKRFTKEDYKGLGGEAGQRDLDGVNILTVKEAEKLLSTAHQNLISGLLPSLVLRLFCGLRTSEVFKLDWKEVRWLNEKEPYVHIPAGKAKKRRVRLVRIPDNAISWLHACNPPKEGRLTPGQGGVKAYCMRFRKLVEEAKLDWSSNDTRHSFGSYHYALHGNAILTSEQLGHRSNDTELFAHYRTLVFPDQARAYFDLKPAANADVVTRFPQAAAAS